MDQEPGFNRGATVACVKIDGAIIHVIEWTDGKEMSYIYEGGDYESFIPLDTVEDCLDDLFWVEGGGKITEADVAAAMQRIKQEYGPFPPTVH
jgi:hypothetical protein